jgi:hypothetical protein
VEPEEDEKWRGIAMLMKENGNVDISGEPGYPCFGRLADENDQADAVTPIGWDPAILAPR